MHHHLEHRLTAVSQELSLLRSEVGVLTEQLASARDVLQERRVRALVAETPLSERALRLAEEDVRRIERVVRDANGRVAELIEERERLLAELTVGRRPRWPPEAGEAPGAGRSTGAEVSRAGDAGAPQDAQAGSPAAPV